MDVITETSLEALLQRATDYRNKNTDTAAIDAFCGIIRKEPDGALIATRLIASKIQSPQEWEALQGLTVLDICMKNCGSSFHSEIGKFRFLNEMIKLVSPKFLGSRTPASVRNQVLKMMYDWTLSYPKEHKIKEAYDMLIKQGVILKEDISQENKSNTSVPQIPPKANPLFQDEEKVRLLQKLLHSKNPDDLQAANRLIKTMVKEDERRVEIKSKKISEVETVRNNVRLLNEMLDSYKAGQTSSEELELIKDLHQGCEKLKTNVFRLASDTQDNDDLLSQILSVGDELDQVLEKYKSIIILEKSVKEVSYLSENSKQVTTLLDLSSPVEELVPLNIQSNISCADILNQPISNSDSDLSVKSSVDAMVSLSGLTKSEKTEPSLNPLDAIFASISLPTSAGEGPLIQTTEQQLQGIKKSKPPEKNSKLKALEELDVLGETLLQQCKINAFSKSLNENQSICEEKCEESDNSKNKINNSEDDILMDLSEENQSAESSNVLSTSPAEINSSQKNEIKPLTDISVSLESIKPSSIPPISVMEEKNGISVKIHMAKDTPRDDVTVYVVTTLSNNPSPLTNYLFQAVVSKGCKLKLQSPSGSELPAHNPFLPPSAITQIMLIANPNKLDVSLKCMISYTMEGETITEMGEVEKLPIAT